MVAAWVTARSIARELPLPVADRGGWRVETHSPDETRRWVFAEPSDNIAALGRAVSHPRQPIKLCGDRSELEGLLHPGWSVSETGFFMRENGPQPDLRLPGGYGIDIARSVGRSRAVILCGGQIAASGYAAETDNAFIFDRIVVGEAHRRRGLGSALVAALGRTRIGQGTPATLVATKLGQHLYAALGWETLSPYATAQLRDPA